MRFKDEREMWSADIEALAAQLSNKSNDEVEEILDAHDVIKLRSCDGPKSTLVNRLALILFVPILILVTGIKWLCTGDRYLDSWEKRNKILRNILKISGLGSK